MSNTTIGAPKRLGELTMGVHPVSGTFMVKKGKRNDLYAVIQTNGAWANYVITDSSLLACYAAMPAHTKIVSISVNGKRGSFLCYFWGWAATPNDVMEVT